MKQNSTARVTSPAAAVAAKWALVICTLMSVSTICARPSSSGSAAGLDGQWYHNGKPTQILVAPDNRSITIVNEQGQRSDGYAASNRELVIPSLGISGSVSENRKVINWTNGTQWTRTGAGVLPSFGLGGPWYHDGQRTSIEVTNDGRNFTIINEHGNRSNGFINGKGELKVPWLQLTGSLQDNGQRISWSNGTTWTRRRGF